MSLEEDVARLLTARGKTIAVAEACTTAQATLGLVKVYPEQPG